MTDSTCSACGGRGVLLNKNDKYGDTEWSPCPTCQTMMDEAAEREAFEAFLLWKAIGDAASPDELQWHLFADWQRFYKGWLAGAKQSNDKDGIIERMYADLTDTRTKWNEDVEVKVCVEAKLKNAMALLERACELVKDRNDADEDIGEKDSMWNEYADTLLADYAKLKGATSPPPS